MISKENFEKMKFETYGFIEPEYEKGSYRLPAGHVLSNHSTVELRKAINNLVHKIKDERKTSISKLIQDECDIPIDTYKKYMNGEKRSPSRTFLSKLCVGLKLPIDEANKLFRIQGGELNLTNDVDAITYYAIICQDNIFDYEEELEEKAGIIPKY